MSVTLGNDFTKKHNWTYRSTTNSLTDTHEHTHILKTCTQNKPKRQDAWHNGQTGKKSGMLPFTFLSFHACASESVSNQRGNLGEARFFAYDIISWKTWNTHTHHPARSTLLPLFKANQILSSSSFKQTHTQDTDLYQSLKLKTSKLIKTVLN